MEFTLERLMSAWAQVRLGTRSAGVDGITLDWFASAVNQQLEILQSELERECYRASPAQGFYLSKKSGGKRLIGIATVRDRIVQRLLLEELYLPLEDAFLDCSYAYRPGRNIQMAVQHLHSYYQFQPSWVVKMDIEKFFDNLCWGLLLNYLEQLQIEPILLQLTEQQIKCGIVIKGKYTNLGQGVLQGSLLSGALANLYLTEFDRKCLSAGMNLVRYGDDFAIACRSSGEAQNILARIGHWLAKIYLRLQPEKTHIFAPNEEFIFLGYRFYQGEVYAPPPPETRAGEWVTNASGMPYFRRKVRPPARRISRPPKACPLNGTEKAVSNLTHYWRETMSSLYVTDQGAYLSVRHQNFQVFYQNELKIKVPVNRVSHIVLFGCCNLSHGAVNLALRRRIPILYLSQRGRYFGRLENEGIAKVEYLAQQVICSQNPDFTRRQAESVVRGKLHNSRILLMRLNRRRTNEIATKAIGDIAILMEKLPFADNLDMLRGYEGKAATIYFQALGSLFTGVFAFEKRTKRPPTDPINSLMSLGYTLLSQNVYSLVQTSGLHTHFGNLHVPRDNHPALVSDLVEEFRAQIVDSLVVYLVNKNILNEEDFTPPDERGGVYLYPDVLKKYLKHWEEKLQTEVTHPHTGHKVASTGITFKEYRSFSQVTHPHTGHKVAYRRCLELQVREYVAALMGEVEVYRPMTWDK